MNAPSDANTSGLEVVAHRMRQLHHEIDGPITGWMYCPPSQHPSGNARWDVEPLVTAASAQARIAELEAELEEARTIDAGFWKWLGERDLQPDGPDVEWGDIVVALTEHEDNAYGIADKASDRATAAEARADRLAKALEPFAAEHECDGHATVEDFNMEVQIFVRWEAIKSARAALQQETQP